MKKNTIKIATIALLILAIGACQQKKKEDDTLKNYLLYTMLFPNEVGSSTCGYKESYGSYAAAKNTASTTSQTVTFEYSALSKSYYAVIIVNSISVGQKLRISNTNTTYPIMVNISDTVSARTQLGTLESSESISLNSDTTCPYSHVVTTSSYFSHTTIPRTGISSVDFNINSSNLRSFSLLIARKCSFDPNSSGCSYNANVTTGVTMQIL